jgi:phosphonate transport system substrate-binding protein
MGVLPDEQASTLKSKYEPLTAYLSEELGQEVQLIIPGDYAALVELFGEGEVDLAYFGGATFVASEAQHQAVPLVMRDIDTRFTSYFLARSDAKETQISDFRDQVIGFGSELSTSGHYMPRYFLKEQAIDPETFFSEVLYSGAHDRTVDMLLKGQVDLAATNSQVVNSMLRQGRLDEMSIKVIWETPEYSDYVWAIQPGWDESYANRLRDAFLALSLSDERDSEILQILGAGGFLPATRGDFFRLRAIVLPQAITDDQAGSPLL